MRLGTGGGDFHDEARRQPLAALADVCLFTSTAEAGMRRGDMASRMAALHVVDILFTGLVSEHFDEYVPLLERSFQTVREYTSK